MIAPRFATPAAVRRIERLAIVFGAGTGVTAIALGVTIAGATGAERMARSRAERLRAETVASRRTLSEFRAAPAEPKIPARAQDQAESVQGRLGAIAAQEGVVLLSYEVPSEATAFASKYGTGAASEGWLAASAQVRMTGPMGGVYGTLRKLAEGAIPIEITAVNVRPGGSAPGSVEASITLAIIVRPADSTGVGAAAGGGDARR